MKVAALWTAPSGYLGASLRGLAEAGTDVFLSYRRSGPSAPFDGEVVSWIDASQAFDVRPNYARLEAALTEFGPDVILFGGWNIPEYRQIAKKFRDRSCRILCMDNQWLGTPRQRLGVLAAPWYVLPLFDAAFVAGNRQATFARRLGFREARIRTGLLVCDYGRFDSLRTSAPYKDRPGTYGFVGRLAPEKGVRDLGEAYRCHREGRADAWPLRVAGEGPERRWLADSPGVELLGFVQPRALPAFLSTVTCLIAPSLSEPWGVSIVEAAASGIPVICTDVCGAVGDVIIDSVNGLVVQANEPPELAAAMARFSGMTVNDRDRWSMAAREAAAAYTPAAFARTVLQLFQDCGRAGER
jgi:glycosyltransferase involved in cell wall biosynthesis